MLPKGKAPENRKTVRFSMEGLQRLPKEGKHNTQAPAPSRLDKISRCLATTTAIS